MTIGDRIRLKREELGLTQQELADKLFVSRHTVSRWEGGSRVPDLMMTRRIAIELQLSMDEMIPCGEILQTRSVCRINDRITKVYAGFDCGGSNTRCMLVSEDGVVLGYGVGGPSNYLFGGKLSASEAIRASVQAAFLDAGIPTCRIEGAFVASAAVEVFCGAEHEAFFRETLNCESVKCDSDIFPIWYAGSRFMPAVTMIAGTGSVVYLLQGKTFVKANGWGSLFGDEGSGYDIGLQALKRASAMADARLALDTDFYHAVLEYFEIDPGDPRSLLNAVLRDNTRKTIASVARLVMQLCKKGNPVAESIVSEAAEQLFVSLKAVVRELDGRVPLLLWGGLLQNETPLRQKLIERVATLTKIERTVIPEQEAVRSAAAIALLNHQRVNAAERLMSSI